MRIDRIKKSSVIEVENDLEKTKKSLAELIGISVSQIWINELDEFLEAWKNHYAKVLEVLNPVGKTAVTKKTVVKTKKSTV